MYLELFDDNGQYYIINTNEIVSIGLHETEIQVNIDGVDFSDNVELNLEDETIVNIIFKNSSIALYYEIREKAFDTMREIYEKLKQ